MSWRVVRYEASRRGRPESVAFQGPFEIGHRFLYKENDARSSLLYRARFMNVLLGVLLGLLLFCWVGEWLGFRAAAVALGLYTIEPNIAAHSSLVTTDLGVTCFIFGAIYFLWRSSRSMTPWNIAGLVAVLRPRDAEQVFRCDSRPDCPRAPGDDGVAPRDVVLPPLSLASSRCSSSPRGWASGRPMDSATLRARSPDWLFALHDHPAAQQAVPTIAALVGWVDGHHLLPNAFSQGFLHGQGLVQGRPSFLAGQLQQLRLVVLLPDRLSDQDPARASCALLHRHRVERQARAASSPSRERHSSSCRSSSSSASR